VGAAVWGISEIARQRSNSVTQPFGGLLGWLAFAALAAAFVPVALPWAFYESNVPMREEGPPNLLVVAIPAGEGAAAGSIGVTPTFDALGAAGRHYRLGAEVPLEAVRALFADAQGEALEPQLAAAGYATAAIFPSEEVLPELARAETHAARGGRGLLEGRLRWLAVAPLLRGPAAALLAALKIDSLHRSAEQVAWQARDWLLEWRSDRTAAPFLLFIDLRGAGPRRGDDSVAEISDAHLAELLEDLEMLEAASSTLVVVLRVPAEGVGRSVHVAMYGPEPWLLPSGTSDPQWVRARTLGQFLLATSRIDISRSADGLR
jgi:hypothetical protein